MNVIVAGSIVTPQAVIEPVRVSWVAVGVPTCAFATGSGTALSWNACSISVSRPAGGVSPVLVDSVEDCSGTGPVLA